MPYKKTVREIDQKYLNILSYTITAMLIAFVLLIADTPVFGLSGGKPEQLEITLVKGKPALVANGVSIPCPEPYERAGLLYIPAKAVLETIGADFETSAAGTVTVTYRETTAIIKAGTDIFTLNGIVKTLPAPPVLTGKALMIPFEFIKICFNVTASFDSKTGKATILLKDDGALTDLSFLTGGISSQRAGNSYFGWSISLPGGTRVASKSFNSKYIQFENESYGFDLEIFIDYGEGKSLKQCYNQIKEDPAALPGVKPIDTTLNLDAKPQYIEVLYCDTYNEAVYERIYQDGSDFISVVATSYTEVDPAKLKSNKTIKSMMDSFSLGYNGKQPDTTDLSTVSGGLAKYSNFAVSESTGKKYLSWEMNIIPDWDLKDSSSANPFDTEFDGKPGEYVKIELATDDAKDDIMAKGKSIIDLYNKNFNPKYYTLKSSGPTQTAGIKSFNLIFEVKYGSNTYDYDERLILANGILYDITLKSPAETFAKNLNDFERMLGTFKAYSKDSGEILAELQKYEFGKTKNNIGKDDSLVIYENKSYKWKITLPGYWQKNSMSGQSLENFYDSKSGAVIAVEASPIKAGEAAKPDRERFASMRISDRLPENPVKTVNEQFRDRNITEYLYRIENEKTETYADVNYYVFDDGGYRYCFMSTIPDLTSSEYNLESLKSIWESFEIVK